MSSDFREWMNQAACRSRYVDANLFHPADSEKPGQRRTRERQARDVCSRCPVQGECLEFSLGANGAALMTGFWGGLNEDQRRTFKRNMQRRAA